MTEKAVVVRRPRPEKMPELAADGDLIEFSMTVEVKDKRNASFWVKAGMTSQVRPTETGDAARQRIETFVQETLDRKVMEILQ